ncbi:hypothetical protein ACWDFL_00285 [Streptomyces bungoensis]
MRLTGAALAARSTAVAGLAVLALTAGCTAGSPSGTEGRSSAPGRVAGPTAAPPEIGAVPRLVSAADRRLPIEDFLLGDAGQDRLDRARAVLVRRCMARFGIAYRAPAAPRQFRPRTLTQLRYGITDADAAARLGYTPAGAGRAKPHRAAAAPLPAREALALNGTDDPGVKPGSARAAGGRVGGRPVPAGGCAGEALRALHADDRQAGGDAPLADRVNYETYELSRRDHRVTAAYGRWSACMRTHGYTYAGPEEAAADPAWRTATATARERAVAATDARCKARTDLVGIWYTVEVAYQKRLVGQHAGELAKIRADLRLRQRLAAEVLDGER